MTAFRALVVTCFTLGLSAAALAEPAESVLFDPIGAEGTAVVLQAEPGGWDRLMAGPQRLELPVLPLADLGGEDGDATLLLERFAVTTPRTRFVLGRRGGPDVPLPYDPSSIKLYRGVVDGVEGATAVLAASPRSVVGLINMPSGSSYAISSKGSGGVDLPAGQLSVFPTTLGGWPLPGVDMCRVIDTGDPGSAPEPDADPIPGLRQLELAVETDYEYYTLFNDLDAAGDYVVQVYALVSDIYVRAINTRIDLTFVRLWDEPDDLFNEPEPLGPFRDYWNAQMGHVQRDLAQFFTGRRDLSAGGVAYLRGVCNNNGYSWAGYVIGRFADPDRPSGFNRDITVTAHEIGHNCGTPHTHDLGLDDCDDATLVARRGTIMSYCGQTYSGGAGNTDMTFHAVVRDVMRGYLADRPCLIPDCNQNGVADDVDISTGTSLDVNTDGVPDECQDCDGDGVLDPEQIAAGASLDRNRNGIPDECETDCNGNGIPDDVDLLPSVDILFFDNFEMDNGWTAENLGATSGDWQRGVPVDDPGWEYDPASDSDGSGQCWLTQNELGNTDVDGGAVRLTSPMFDLTFGDAAIAYDYFLRLTRSAAEDRLLVEISDDDGASWQPVIAHDTDGGLNWRTHVISEADIIAAGASMTSTMRIRFTANDDDAQSIVEAGLDAFILARYIPPVSVDENFNEVPDECEPDCDGDGRADYLQILADMYLDITRDLILDGCQDCDSDGEIDLIALDHAHNVWVTSLEDPELYEFYGATGVRTRITEETAINMGADLLITPDRRILISSATDSRIAEFDMSGTHIGDLVAAGAGGLDGPGTMLIHPDGLLVASERTGSVKLYDLTTGAYIRDFVEPGAGGLTGPFGLAFSKAGSLLVTSADNQVLEYDGATGAFSGVFVSQSDNGGLDVPRAILVMPDGRLLVTSYNTDNVLAFDGDTGAFIDQFQRGGTVDRLVLEEPWGIRLGPDGGVYVSTSHVHPFAPTGALHLTNARIYHYDPSSGFFIRAFVLGNDTGLYHPSGFDFVPGDATDCNGNFIPDNCDIATGLAQDCNTNGVPDDCDIRLGTSKDANGNGVPDECECYADCDGTGTLDIFDFLCFQNAFGTGDPYADCDGTGVLDLFDFLCFQNEFGAGCP